MVTNYHKEPSLIKSLTALNNIMCTDDIILQSASTIVYRKKGTNKETKINKIYIGQMSLIKSGNLPLS